MGAVDIRNITFDGGSAKIRWGARAIPMTKFGLPKESIKREKLRRIGEQVSHIRTIGNYECEDFTAEMEALVWSSLILPNLPEHGGSLFEFPITVQQKHPLAGGAYTCVLDRVCFTGIEPDGIDNSEKATIVKVVLSAIQVFHKGADGKFKSLAINPRQPAPSTAAFLF